MNLLAIDTSSSGTLVVARSADGRLAQRAHRPGAGQRPAHTTLGLSMAADALDELRLAWADLARVGVGIGPGSFTGLRAGLSAAAGLARRLSIPLIGVTATELLAAGAAASAGDRPILAVVDGRRRELFVQRWARIGSGPRTTGASDPPAGWRGGPLQVVSRADLTDVIGQLGGALAVGDGALLERDALLALGADVPGPDDLRHRLAAEPFAALVEAGAPADADTVRPAYGRDADAVPTAQRRQR
ncbi:MAG: tRNA (adenosine(37)-N6)-threonylcarbamoyltransferase complex dimerization subunit type 1 TsaB [Patulibacter sp.]